MIAIINLGIGFTMKLIPDTNENRELIAKAIKEIGKSPINPELSTDGDNNPLSIDWKLSAPTGKEEFPATYALEYLLQDIKEVSELYCIQDCSCVAVVTFEW